MLRLACDLSTHLGKSVVLSMHILQDVESVRGADVVLEHGSVVRNGPMCDLPRAEENGFTLAAVAGYCPTEYDSRPRD